MPRLLTLWLDVCSVNAAIADRGRSGGRSSGSAQNRRSSASDISGIQADCTAIVGKAISDVPSFMWYTCLPQLVSRVGHPNPEVKQTIVNCLVKVLSELPYHAMWHITGLSLSLNESRRELGSEIVRKAQMQLLDGGKDADSMSIGDAKRLFQDLIGCAKAGADDRAKSMKYPIGRNLELQRLIAPVQRALTVSLPAALAQKQKPALAARKKGSNRISGGDGNHVPFPVGQLHMQAFAEKIGIMNSKAKPKKLTLALLENASSINFLCKQERNGDLRKDARLMEFNGVVNRLLQRDPDGRRRKLSLRTYSVVCLNEECGLIEWVQGTAAFRQAVSESKNARPALSVPRLQEIIHTIQEKQTSVDAMVDLYQRKVLSVFPPTFHRWFLLHFREPTAWFDARTLFTRSAAVWSAVGHVVGLGDRHGENILLDTFSGECVHVDFDCIFDKGLTLRRPEIVPFRLTPNMVDGMGLTGYEGVYRRVMEVSMTVLRANRETLLSVLEPFLQDPTVGWGRTGRAQQDGTIVSSESACGDLARDIENEDARRTLKTIEERLSGMYNLRLPSKTKASSAKSSGRSSKAGLNNKSPGGSGGDAREIPLSIKGQVHRLIHESTSQANLCKMYIG
jgi:serine/threonine-protein kinase ATR